MTKGKFGAELTASYQFFLRFFPAIYHMCCACHEKAKADYRTQKSVVPATQKIVDTLRHTSQPSQFHEVPRRPCKTILQPDLPPSEEIGFATCAHTRGEAKGKPETADETCCSIKASMPRETSSIFSHFVASKATFFPGAFVES